MFQLTRLGSGTPTPIHTYIAVVVVLIIFCFHVLSLSHGSSWGDDWAMYVNHAYNMVHGRPYTFPGYVFNPMYATYAPTNYPAGYPILLMPVVAVWGLALTPMKILNLVMFSLALIGLWYWLRARLHPIVAIALITLVGMSPFHWLARDQILSDTPFLTFTVAFFLCYDHFKVRPGWRIAVLLGFLMAFIYALRSAGMFLIIAFILHTIIASPILRKYGAIAILIAVVLVVIHNSLIPSTSYFTMMSLSQYQSDPFLHFYNGFAPYIADLDSFILVDSPNLYAPLGKITMSLLIVFMAAGLISVRHWTVLETYICIHFAALAFFPGYQGFRYLVGFFPFMLFYAFYFIQHLPLRWLRIAVSSAMLIMLVLCINRWYVQNYSRDIPGSILDEGAQKMFAFIRQKTPDDAVIIADKPRAISLYTDRKATVYPEGQYADKWLDWLQEANVSYAIKMSWEKELPYRYWAPYIDSHPEEFTLLFEHSNYQIWSYPRKK